MEKIVCNKMSLGTKEQENRLLEIINEHKNRQGALIPVLHEAQGVYGFLPESVQEKIAEGLKIPLTEVYGVVTFYTHFTMVQKGDIKVSVCLGTACYVKGVNDILDRLEQKLGIKVGETTEDRKFSLDATRCLGACGLAPVITINDTVFGKVKVDQIDGIIKKYKKDN